MDHFYQTLEGYFHFRPLYERMVSGAADDAVFVELGVWKGMSAAYMGVRIANSGKRISLYAVDAFGDSMYDGDGSDDERYSEVVRVLEPVQAHVRVVRSRSVDAAALFADGAVDFVFVDACHDCEAVKADISAWLPKVRSGGLLAGDDYGNAGYPGVKRAVDELLPTATIVRMNDQACVWEYVKP